MKVVHRTKCRDFCANLKQTSIKFDLIWETSAPTESLHDFGQKANNICQIPNKYEELVNLTKLRDLNAKVACAGILEYSITETKSKSGFSG